jgi:hypothetical protein
MKAKKQHRKAIDRQLYDAFKDVCIESEIEALIKDAKRAFTLVQRDVLYNKGNNE